VAPDPRTLIVNAPADQSVEVRLAARGFSRRDPDTPGAALLTIVARHRWVMTSPELARNPVYVRHDAFALPGMFVMGASTDNLLAGKTLASARDVMQSLGTSPVTQAELEQAKTEAMSLISQELAKPDGIAKAWLDNDTYALPSVAEQVRALKAVTSGDLQRVATRLIRDGGFASVIVGNSAVLKAQLGRNEKLEIMGEITPATEVKSEAKPDPNVKPQTRSPAKPD
jgi:hypothetical protein